MGLAENSKTCRQKINQRNSAENDIKYFVRSSDKNAKNVVFRTRDEDTSILGERCNADNHC